MGYVMTAEIKLTDKVSPVLNDIGTNGKRVIAGMEEDFAKLNSSMSKTSRTANRISASLAKLSGDTSQVVSHSRELATAMVDEAEKMRKVAQVEEKLHTSATKTAVGEKQVAEALNKSEQQAEKYVQTASKVVQTEEKLHASATKTAVGEKQVAEALNKSEQQAEEYASAVRRASNESEKLGRQGESTAQLLESAFTALAVERVIVGIKDAFVACSKAAIEYESAITGVYKTVNGSEAQLSEISDDIKLMSLEIPSTTTEIAGVAESAGQLGIETENVTGFTEVMINLGESTNLAADEAASYLAKYSNITGMAADKYENLGSTVVALGNNFATTEADIVAMATRMASAGTLAGLTESDILGLAAAMSSVGIEADAGGSAMSTLLSNIQIAVETGNDSLNDFSSVANMTAEEFQTAFKDNAAGALYAFIDGLNDVERNGATATVVLENMGITEIRLSNAVKALANNSEGLSGAIKLAGEAWDENTALATEAELRYGTLESRLNITRNAANNLKIAIGDVLNPVVGDFADAGTDALVWLTEFTENNPTVVAGITGITTALVTAAGAVTICSTVVTAFNTAMKALNITISASKLWFIIGGISAAGAVIGSLAYHFSSAEEQVEDYNGTLMQCREEIEATETSYRNVCDMYGENSQAAQSLSAELDTLNAQYEKGGGFIADYEQRLTESKDALNSFTTEYNNKMNDIDIEWQSGLIATAQLEALSDKAQLTNADLDIMSNYADYLNDTFNCDIKVNYDTGELTGFDPENVTDILIKDAKEKRIQVAADSITDSNFTNDFINDFKELEESEKIFESWESELKKIASDSSYISPIKVDYKEYLELENEIKNGKDLISDYEEQINNAFAVMGDPEGADEYIEYLKKISSGYEETGTVAEESCEKMKDPLEAAHEAVESQADEIYKLAEAYDEAYNAAYESFMGQFGLFDEAQMNTEATVENAQAALDSQLAYWTAYSENISYLSSVSAETLGITQANYDLMMQYVRSGDAEAAGLAESMVAHIENGNAEAVSKMAETLGQIDSKQSESADLVAEWETNIEEHMNRAFNTAEQSIQKIEGLDGNVKNAAVKIIQSYAQGIRDTQSVAVTAAGNLAAAVQAKFNSVSIKIPSLSSENSNPDNHYASGTLSAKSGVALVGERGPELVVLQGGERIYTASETERILNNSSMISSALTENHNVYNNAEKSTSINTNNTELFSVWNNHYASGTLSAKSGVALVGERGPELVVLQGGERIYTASETERILNNNSLISSAFNEKELIYNNSESAVSNIFSSENNTSEFSENISSENESILQNYSDKTLFIPPPDSPVKPFERKTDNASKREFSIDINGKGSIDVKGGMNKEQVVEILFDHMKPVLMNILAQEIFEEGDNTYEI